MTLTTAKYLTASTTDNALQFNSENGCQAVSRGLRLIITGYVVLIGGTALGLFLVRWGLQDGPLVRLSSAAADDRDLVLLMAVLTLGLTALFSYGLVLVGQWHCLMYSPQAQHAKELMYVCFNCLLLASLLNGLGAYLVQAAQSKDLAVVQGISLVLVTAFVLVNMLVDVLYAVLDPRVSLGSRAQ